MEFGITLYEALVSANVAGDKAKAVVTVMEKEMFERLATKQEIINLESRMTVKLGAMIFGAAGLVIAVFKLMP